MRRFLSFVPILALGCATAAAPAPKDRGVGGWEGFFEVDRLDDSTLSDIEIPVPRATLDALGPRVVRLILAAGPQEATEEALALAFEQYCATPADRAWNEDRCKGYEAKACAGGLCTYPHFGSCSGFMMGGELAMTAAHCVADLGEDLRAASSVLVRGSNGEPTRHRLEVVRAGKTDFSHHWVTAEPDAMDVAVLRISGERFSAVQPVRLPQRAAVVFVLGYPRVEGRQSPKGYRKVPGRLAASFGRLDDANEAERPFCSTDGQQEGWSHATPCPRVAPPDEQKMWRGPIAHHTFTTTMDTINGYSGAPVFNAQGDWIGVNSTVSGGVNPQQGYHPALRAVVTRATAALSFVPRP